MWENSQTPVQTASARSARTPGGSSAEGGAESRALAVLSHWTRSGGEWPHGNAAADPWERGSR